MESLNQINYNGLRNILCPLRHFFNSFLQVRKKNSYSLSSILGMMIHHTYHHANITKKENFDFVTPEYVKNFVKKYAKNQKAIIHVNKFLKNHLHLEFLHYIKPFLSEQQLTVQLPLISVLSEKDAFTLYVKPDLYAISELEGIIIEIKTGVDVQKLDPFQLYLYAWVLCNKHPHLETFSLYIYSTIDNQQFLIDTITKQKVLDIFETYLSLLKIAYETLKILSISEANNVISSIIEEKPDILGSLQIPTEYCSVCSYSIVCPAYLQEYIPTFTQRVKTNTKSDVLLCVGSVQQETSSRLLYQERCLDFLQDILHLRKK